MLKEGEKAPIFSALDQENKEHSLIKYQNSWVLLYFYPKDNTPGCTKEACAFRDFFSEFKKSGIKILGVSKDTVASHKKFALKHQLPFILLSDGNKEIIKNYQANGIFKRVSYLIDPKGYIAKIYPKIKIEEHAQEILNDFREIKTA